MAAHSAETESDDLLVLLEQVLWAHRPEFRFIRDGLSRTMSEIYRTIANRQAEDLSPTDLAEAQATGEPAPAVTREPSAARHPPSRPEREHRGPRAAAAAGRARRATSHHTHAETRPAAGATTAQVWEWLHLQALRLPAADGGPPARGRRRGGRRAILGRARPAVRRGRPPGLGRRSRALGKLTEQLAADEVARYHELLEPLAAVLGVLSRSTDIMSAHRLDGQKAGIVLDLREQRLQYVQRAIKAAAKLSGPRGRTGSRRCRSATSARGRCCRGPAGARQLVGRLRGSIARRAARPGPVLRR